MAILGLVMLIIGWVLLFLQVLRVLSTSIWLCMVAYMLLVFGLVLGLIAVMGAASGQDG